MSDHAETALDQLRLADDLLDPEPTRDQLRQNACAAAIVHACFHVAKTAELLATGEFGQLVRTAETYEAP